MLANKVEPFANQIQPSYQIQLLVNQIPLFANQIQLLNLIWQKIKFNLQKV